MIYELYCIKDELSEFASPLPLKDEATAKRFFRQQVESTPMMKNNPEDFSIWKIGTFDSESAEIKTERAKLIERAKAFKK